MLVLALDTTVKGGSCALTRDGRILSEAAGDPGRPHDARLPGELKTLLDHAGLALDTVDAFAVATGPGSFTGLRIGIATMQGLAFAAGKPLAGVSAFDALARLAGETDGALESATDALVATWIDAWRGEVYTALYEDGDEIEPPTVERPDELLSRLGSRKAFFIGDGAAQHRATIVNAIGSRATFADPIVPPLAGVIGVMAEELAHTSQLSPPHAIRPLYVRRPDAELARDARPVR